MVSCDRLCTPVPAYACLVWLCTLCVIQIWITTVLIRLCVRQIVSIAHEFLSGPLWTARYFFGLSIYYVEWDVNVQCPPIIIIIIMNQFSEYKMKNISWFNLEKQNNIRSNPKNYLNFQFKTDSQMIFRGNVHWSIRIDPLWNWAWLIPRMITRYSVHVHPIFLRFCNPSFSFFIF